MVEVRPDSIVLQMMGGVELEMINKGYKKLR